MCRKFSSFEELAADFASREGVALRYAKEDGTEAQDISYATLADMIAAEVTRLRIGDDESGGAGKGVVTVRADHSPDTIVSIFANVIAGRDVLLADPMLPDDTVSAAAEAVDVAREMRAVRRHLRKEDPASSMHTALSSDGESARSEGEILFFTSGTTSRSKIVRLTSRSLCTSAWSGQSMLACGPGDILLSVLPLSHVFGFVCALLWGLCYGAAVALGRGVRHMVDDSLFYDPTIIPAVPSLMEAMLKFGTLNPGLKTALIGAASCTPETAAALRERGIDVYLGYGLTETSSGIAITQDLDEPDALYPCPGADIKIEKDGEVTVETPCMMEGYVGRPLALHNKRLFTGDLGWFDDRGRLHLKGRKKDVIIMPDGTKIFCPEYEADLMQSTGLPDIGIIEKDGHAVLVAGSCPTDTKSSADIEKKLRREIKKYNGSLLRSQQIYDIIVTSETLPRTVTGKLKRYELQERFN